MDIATAIPISVAIITGGTMLFRFIRPKNLKPRTNGNVMPDKMRKIVDDKIDSKIESQYKWCNRDIKQIKDDNIEIKKDIKSLRQHNDDNTEKIIAAIVGK